MYADLYAYRMWRLCCIFSCEATETEMKKKNKHPSLRVFLYSAFLLLYFLIIHMNKTWNILHIQNIFLFAPEG